MRLFTLFCFLVIYGNLSAQKEDPTLFLTIQYGGQLPALDFKNRFGTSLRPAAVLSYQLPRKLNVWSATGFFQFGTLVKEDVFSNLLTPDGYLIGNDKNPAAIQLRQRAWFIGFGKGWRFKERSNFLNRFLIDVHGGFFQHKIRIQEDPARLVPQINGEYKKGYDRLSNGTGININMSYNPTANPTFTRFVVGLDLFAAHTINRRPVNFNTGFPDKSSFWVLQPGIHLAYHFKKVFKDPASLKY
jgi:hypothetical protein